MKVKRVRKIDGNYNNNNNNENTFILNPILNDITIQDNLLMT